MLIKTLTPRKTLLALALAPAALGLAAQSAQAQSVDQKVADLEAQINALKTEVAATKSGASSAGGTEFTFGGFIKLDAMYSMYSDGDRATASIGDDFYIPSTVPIGGNSGEKFDMHAKQSRFNVKGVSNTDAGKVTGFLEIDFQLSSQGDERISNSYAPRVRHAFLSWDYSNSSSFLAGQTWSTFFNVAALPNTVDFVGPAGTIFQRQAMVRWSHKLSGGNSFHIGLENPSTGLNGAGGAGDIDSSNLPDVTARFDIAAGDASYSIAGVGRELRYKNNGANVDEAEFGFGLSGSAIWKFGADDLKVMLNYGTLGRYMGLQSYRDGFIDTDGGIELADQMGGFIAYKHAWNSLWRSSLVLSASASDNPEWADPSSPKEYQSMHANLIYSPTKKLNLGGEVIYGEKTLESGAKGDLTRLQFMVMYTF